MQELLGFAKHRLQKFYNPKSFEFLQTLSEHHVASMKSKVPGPQPATWTQGYRKKEEESSNVVGMLDVLIRDLDKEIAQAKKEEELAQKEYEELMNDSAEKRKKDMRSVQVKSSAIADCEEVLTTSHGDVTSKEQELTAVQTFSSKLHAECDWMLQNFDLRKSARAEEVDALNQAKSILSGASFSFIQASSKALLLARRRRF
jgi:chromosome segregation ATPase